MKYYRLLVPCVAFALFAVSCDGPTKRPNNAVEILNCFKSSSISKFEDYHLCHDSVTADIVALGESTHGSAAILTRKIEITKFLIEHCGFRKIGIEATFSEVLELDKFIKGNSSQNVEASLKRLGYPFLLNVEFRDFLIWLKQHNLSVNSDEVVDIFGIDTSVSNAPIKAIIQFAERYSKPLAIAFDTLFRLTEDSGIYKYDRQFYGITRVDSALTAKLTLIGELLGKDSLRLVKLSSVEEFILLKQNLSLLKQLDRRIGYEIGSLESENSRDSSMFLNVMNYVKNDAKIVVWAHNEHIKFNQKTSTKRTMGTLLKDRYHKRFFSMGMDFKSGKYFSNGPGGLRSVQAEPIGWPFLNVKGVESNGEQYFDFSELEKSSCLLKAKVHSIGAFDKAFTIQEETLNQNYSGFIYLSVSNELTLLNPN